MYMYLPDGFSKDVVGCVLSVVVGGVVLIKDGMGSLQTIPISSPSHCLFWANTLSQLLMLFSVPEQVNAFFTQSLLL